jgi:outer membrane protein assembly factor BamB
VPWRSKDGLRNGWKVTIPGRRPLATLAVADGRLFLGGGFGSYDFYALDAATGQVLWQYQTEDDGPTAAVMHEGCVAFNTECCELEVLTVEGKPVWKRWLGDPLMSTPAVAGGRIYLFPSAASPVRDLAAPCGSKVRTQASLAAGGAVR